MNLEALKEKCEEDMWIDSDIVLQLIKEVEKKEAYGKMLMDSVRYAQHSASVRLSKNVELQKEIEQLNKKAEGYRSNWIKSSDKTIELQKENSEMKEALLTIFRELEQFPLGLHEAVETCKRVAKEALDEI